MSFNVDELRKIKKATSGIFKKKSRVAVANALIELEPKIQQLDTLDESERQDTLKALVNQATRDRQAALHAGATGHGDAEWAAAAACESWLHDLALGTSESKSKATEIVHELIARRR